MPCYDSRDDQERAQAAVKYGKMEAILCGITKAFTKEEILAKVNWTQAGVEKEFFENWLLDHQIKDAVKESTAKEKIFYNVAINHPAVPSNQLWDLAKELEKIKGSLGIYGESAPLVRLCEYIDNDEKILRLLCIDESNVAIKISDISYSSRYGVLATITLLGTPKGNALKELCADSESGYAKPNFTVKPRILAIGGKKVLVTFDVYPNN